MCIQKILLSSIAGACVIGILVGCAPIVPAPTIERVLVLNEANSPRIFRYKVRSGDTLYAISRLHGISVDMIAQMNGIAAPYVIYPGDDLVVDRKLVATEQTTREHVAARNLDASSADSASASSSSQMKDEPPPKPPKNVTVTRLPRPSLEDSGSSVRSLSTASQSAANTESKPPRTTELEITEVSESPTKNMSTPTKQEVEPQSTPKPEVAETPSFVARTEPTETTTEATTKVDDGSLPKGWTKPVSAKPTNSFGKDDGLNYYLNQGNSVVAAASGRVIYAGIALGDFKHMVLIKTPDDYVIQYDFNVDLNVQENDLVSKGQDLVKIVNTSKGQHHSNSDEYRKLFFAIWKKGVPQNPDKLIGKTDANET